MYLNRSIFGKIVVVLTVGPSLDVLEVGARRATCAFLWARRRALKPHGPRCCRIVTPLHTYIRTHVCMYIERIQLCSWDFHIKRKVHSFPHFLHGSHLDGIIRDLSLDLFLVVTTLWPKSLWFWIIHHAFQLGAQLIMNGFWSEGTGYRYYAYHVLSKISKEPPISKNANLTPIVNMCFYTLHTVYV